MKKSDLSTSSWNPKMEGIVMVLLCAIHATLYLLHFDESALFQWDAERDLGQTLQ